MGTSSTARTETHRTAVLTAATTITMAAGMADPEAEFVITDDCTGPLGGNNGNQYAYTGSDDNDPANGSYTDDALDTILAAFDNPTDVIDEVAPVGGVRVRTLNFQWSIDGVKMFVFVAVTADQLLTYSIQSKC